MELVNSWWSTVASPRCSFVDMMTSTLGSTMKVILREIKRIVRGEKA